jgi:hypothetical protein
MLGTAFLVVVLGGAGALFGGWGYFDHRAARTFRWWPRMGYSNFGIGPGGPALLVLDGAGLILVGIALALGRNAFSLALLWIGCAAIAAGLVLYLWRPTWAQPRWMRRSG